MSELPVNVLRYGVDEPLPEQRPLRAGPLSLIFENGDLRYIRLGDREVLRRVYAAVRDQNWDTLSNVITNLEIDDRGDSFSINYDVENRKGDIHFTWRGEITGDRDGAIRFAMDGVAKSTFKRNRLGICVLHPVKECAGRAATVEKADGSVEDGEFPLRISPHQPFMDIRAITHEVEPRVTAEVHFEGEVFEMEDQRNWTDASYKTYSTPLRIPYPVEVPEGTRISQSVTLTLKGWETVIQQTVAGGGLVTQAPVAIVPQPGTGPSLPLPRLGLGVASHGRLLTEQEAARLRALNLSHLRVDLDMTSPGHDERLRRATAEAAAVGAGLEVALTLTSGAADELASLAGTLDSLKPPVQRWLIFHGSEKVTPASLVATARDSLRPFTPDARFAAGTNAYFTELNRNRPGLNEHDAVVYSINPQVHAFDNSSLMETLETQAETVESAERFAGERRIVVSPVTLKPRSNPNALGPEQAGAAGGLPPQVDPRQMSLFCAAWTIGSIRYLSQGGARSVTYFETTGWRGVMETVGGSPAADTFRSIPGTVFPVYHVLADVGEFSGGEWIRTETSAPLRAHALALRKGDRMRVLVANVTNEPQTVHLTGMADEAVLRVLDETNVISAMTEPEAFRRAEGELIEVGAGPRKVTLRPYAVARIDCAAPVQGTEAGR